MSIFSNIIRKVFGRKSDKDLKTIAPLVGEINLEYSNLKSLSDNDLKNKFLNIRNDLNRASVKFVWLSLKRIIEFYWFV